MRRYKKTEYSQEELRKTFTEELHMGVVRLAGGSLLLYSPVQIKGSLKQVYTRN